MSTTIIVYCFVPREERGQGLGQMMMEKVAEEVAEQVGR